MQHPGPTASPGEPGTSGIMSDPNAEPDEAERVESLIADYQATVERRLEDGLRAIQHTANALMHEIASEVWRAAGGDKDEVGSRILEELSRDQALRGLIAHADERFQALALRTARLEDTLNLVAESVRESKEQLAASIGALGEGGVADGDASELRAQLAQVTRHVASALATLAERDQTIVDSVRERIVQHGELMMQETTRISRAMESYVQHGVEAIGQLAGTMEGQLQAIGARDDEIVERFRQATEEQMALLGEQLHLMYERMALDARSATESVTHLDERTQERIRELGEYLHLVNDRVDVAARNAADQMGRALEARVMGLARLVRSDAEALRGELVRTAEQQDERIASALDERLAPVSDALAAATSRMVAELTGHLERLGSEIADRAARAADLAIGERFDDIVARLHETSASLERNGQQLGAGRDEIRKELSRTVEEGVAALARLVRSDNQTLAQQIVADQEASKLALRAVKELQANLPSEVIEMVEQRFASLAESIERSNEMLAKRIDRMAASVGSRRNDDLQVVIDRMGDAMHALASLGREGTTAPAPGDPRIDLG